MTLIELLTRGGHYGHYWLKQSKQTIWWPTSEIPEAPAVAEDLYFGVHPSKSKGNPTHRTTTNDIAAINCLYADIDSKDYNKDKRKAAEHIKALKSAPSVIVDSGGGYHCYWLLERPFALDTPLKTEIAKSLQQRWVAFVGGDTQVHDLARVLRLPGTLNYKYDPPRGVQIVHANFRRLYTPEALEALLPPDKHRGDFDEKSALKIPAPVRPNTLSLQEIVNKAQGARGGSKFTALWRGWNEGYDSASEADLAFCCLLAFWTGGDYKKIDQLFRASDRMRDKWEREDYQRGTILRALGQVTEYYVDPGGYLTAGADDEGNAQCAYAHCKSEFLYCSAFGWMQYSKDHWASGALAEAALDRTVVRVLKERRSAAAKGGTEEDEKRMEAIVRAAKPSATNVRNCKTLLKSLLTVSVDTFDVSLDEINCPNGVLDLRTGSLTPHNSTKRFSYCLPVPYDREADVSVWTAWLLETVGEKQEVLDFLQMAVGYSLTGRTREEVMFYVYGPARAGKGTFTETLQAMLGGRPLATEVGMETFLEKRGSGDQGFDLAGLKATRFVAASESKDSHWLDAAKLKRWTGGSPITCAHKYQRAFTYQPQFKIWLVSNFPPRMDMDDVAGWTRPQVIRFPNSHLGKEDKTLKELMRSPEVLEGVLAWAVEGAIKWYALPKGGLRAPDSIVAEKRAAQRRLDWVAEFVEEEALINTGGEDDRVSNAALMARYRDWCLERGVSPKKLAGLKASLRRLGFVSSQKAFRDSSGKSSRGLVGAKFAAGSLRESLAKIGSEDE